jgi:hypothetical protein
MAQQDFEQKLDMCETSYTDQMQHMRLSLEKKAAVEVSTRMKARLLDAAHMHYEKAQIMTVMRFFGKWRQAVVLDKTITTFVEVIVPCFIYSYPTSSHLSPTLTSSHFDHLILSPLILYMSSSFSHLIPYHFLVFYPLSFLSYLILIVVSYRRHKTPCPITCYSILSLSYLSCLILIVVSYRRRKRRRRKILNRN